MSQNDVNHAEWSDPKNWGDGVMRFYFSKSDSRSWVPKQQPRLGWTLNMAHRHAGLWLTALASIPFLCVVVAWVVAASVTAG